MTERHHHGASKIKELQLFSTLSRARVSRQTPSRCPDWPAVGRRLCIRWQHPPCRQPFAYHGPARETRTGHSVWAERYDRQLEDVFEIQDEIAQNIARALRVMLTEKEKTRNREGPHQRGATYDYYLRGRQFLYQFRRKGLEFARQMFARAIVIDPKYARPSQAWQTAVRFCICGLRHGRQFEEAITAAAGPPSSIPNSAEAHASRACRIAHQKYASAEIEFETSIRLNRSCLKPITSTAARALLRGKMRRPLEC